MKRLAVGVFGLVILLLWKIPMVSAQPQPYPDWREKEHKVGMNFAVNLLVPLYSPPLVAYQWWDLSS